MTTPPARSATANRRATAVSSKANRATRGRPPGAKNLKTLLNISLNELVIVTENGGYRKISKREAIITQLVNRSAKADLKAVQILLAMLRDIEGHAEAGAADADIFTEADEQIIQRIRARLRGEQE